jgi:hypothetical protein
VTGLSPEREADGLILVERGQRRCRKCGKPHNCYRKEPSTTYGSWASLDDGHAYYPESTGERADRLEQAIRDALDKIGEPAAGPRANWIRSVRAILRAAVDEEA